MEGLLDLRSVGCWNRKKAPPPRCFCVNYGRKRFAHQSIKEGPTPPVVPLQRRWTLQSFKVKAKCPEMISNHPAKPYSFIALGPCQEQLQDVKLVD